MNLLQKLWNDDAGVLLSAEAVVVGTVAAAGITAGATTLVTSVNAELKELAFSIRSLDQSYCIPAQESCHACSAGSSFTQAPVEDSLAELREFARVAEEQQAQQLKEQSDAVEAEEETLIDGPGDVPPLPEADSDHRDDDHESDAKAEAKARKKSDAKQERAKKKKKNKKRSQKRDDD